MDKINSHASAIATAYSDSILSFSHPASLIYGEILLCGPGKVLEVVGFGMIG
jgi:hypothetical protein